MSKKAIHTMLGEVQIVAGPVWVNGHSYYWVVRDKSDAFPETAHSKNLTFPPHKEYWANHYEDGSVHKHQTLEDAKNGRTNYSGGIVKDFLFTERVWQEEPNGEWKVEVVADE